ncbi:MAG: radical SAM protein [Clostridia bacterium]|nr:radical SAM protein [Clostridia bacterium]
MLTVYAIEISEIYGHGQRAVIWFSGCTLHCKGCINEYMWNKSVGRNYTVEELINSVSAFGELTGVTLIGGEPLQQGEELLSFVGEVLKHKLDIVLFTGYELNELSEWQKQVVNKSAVVICGRYKEEFSDTNLLLRGSSNQAIIINDEKLKDFYSRDCRQVEIEITADGDKFLGFPEDFLP